MLILALALGCARAPEGPVPVARDHEGRGRAEHIVAADLAGLALDRVPLGPLEPVAAGHRELPGLAQALGEPGAGRIRLDLHPDLPLGVVTDVLFTVDRRAAEGCERPELVLSVEGGVVPLPVARIDDLLLDPIGDRCPWTGRFAGAPQVHVLAAGYRLRRRGEPTRDLDRAALVEALAGPGPVVVVLLRDGKTQELVELLDLLRLDAHREPAVLVGFEREAGGRP